ncbi:sugar kinase [Chelativorans salis]|uniref:Sugar kinase n=1 Tax=Chelativorans salis TaxID=2978478 RepID=A0ABT2LNN3_9HYPH|nr:sugar kinase [Chelativorans sp. EGI FJ00035]MCT7375283.1 sugar kinase [Chelativorans sp. EGI FJ00035]
MEKGGVASVGECMLELSGGSGGNWRMGHAGDTFNTLWAMRALTPESVAADYVSAFGDDPFSAEQRKFFADHGIGTAASPVIQGRRPGLYAITLDGAERSFTYWRADSAARCLADDPKALEKTLENQVLVYFSGITLAILEEPARKTLIAALEAARKGGSRIAFDPNYRPRLWTSPEAARAAVDAALAVSDIALPTFPDEAELYDDPNPAAAVRRLAQAGVSEIAIKNGAGATFLSAGGREASIPAIVVADPVDTTGAGDSFNGAYLASRLAGDEPERAVRRGHNVAAAVIQVHGALAPFSVLREAFARA